MEFNLRRSISPVILAFVLAGCGDSTKPIDLRVGLFVAEKVKLSVMLHNPCRGIKEDPGLDKDLESTMTTAFRRVFASVDVLESYPTPKLMDSMQLDLVVIAEVKGAGGTFGYQGAKIWNRGESDHSLSVKLSFYTHEMKQVTSVMASGSGTTESIGILFTAEKRALVKSVKSAIRNLGDDVAQQVYVNPDIRKIAKQNRK